MKQNLRKVKLLDKVGNKAKGVQITLSAPVAAKLIKDGKAELITENETVKPVKPIKKKRK